MKKHPMLKKVADSLKDGFTFEWQHPNIVFVYTHAELPDAQLMVDSNYPDDVLISVNVCSPHPNEIASLVLGCMYIAPARMAECFYIDGSYKFHFGENAYAAMEFENTEQHSGVFH